MSAQLSLSARRRKFARPTPVEDARTTTDRKNEACFELLRLASLIVETVPHLNEVRDALRDRSATAAHREKLAADMKKYDIPLLTKAVELITVAATETCPLAGMKEHFRKNYGDEKRTLSQTRLSKDITPAQYMVSCFINDEAIETPRKPPPRSVKVVSPNVHALPTQGEKELVPHLRHRFEQFKIQARTNSN